MAAHYFNTVENAVTGKPVSNASVAVTDSSDVDLVIYSNEGLTTQIDNPIITDDTGWFEFYCAEDECKITISYGGATVKTIDNINLLGGTVSADVAAILVRLDNHDTLLGTAANATNLGTFTGSTIADNSSVKTSLQALETAVETKATSGAATSSGLTMATSRLLGRTTASTGAVEEISVGAGLTLSGGSLTASASGSYISQGTHTIPILANAMFARTTNGAAAGTSESTTNKVMLKTLDYDQSTAEYAQIVIPMPKSWDEGTVTCQFIWTASATGNVVWGCQAIALSDDDAVDTAFGTAQTVTDGVTASGDVMESAFTSAITVGGSPAAEDLVVFQFYRDAANGSDTLAADAKLIAVRLKYTVNAGDDT